MLLLSRTSRCASLCLVNRTKRTFADAPEDPSALRAVIADLTAKLTEKDAMIRVLQMQLLNHGLTPASSTELPPFADLVANEEDLLNAFQRGTSTMTLESGRCYEFPHRIVIENKNFTMCSSGPVPATIRGQLKFQKDCRVAATNVRFLGLVSENGSPMDSPCVEISGRSAFRAEACVFESGRDGISLNASSSVDLHRCSFLGNVRGLFEGLKCAATISECTFRDNTFHMILLGACPGGSRARVSALEAARNEFACSSPNRSSRGDVAFKYNPLLDAYDDVYKDGNVIVLTSAEQSTNLVDPTW